MPTRTPIFTSHFVDSQAVIDYYKPLGFRGKDVAQKVKNKEIYIGRPRFNPKTEFLRVNGEGRFIICYR